jgi:hypothetical protein
VTDRELTEAAAKVAGLWDAKNNCIDIPWSPLTNDGDALRLAVKLDIYFMVVAEQGFVSARVRNGVRSAWNEPIGNDSYAATRRAIVRAAAAMAG